MGAAPLGARDGARRRIGTMGGGRPRGLGTLAAAHRARSPTASARSSARRPARLSWGRTFRCCRRRSRPASTFAASATKSCTKRCSFRRSRTSGANGNATAPRSRVVRSDDGRTIPTERIVDAITEKTAIAVLSHAYYVSGAIADVRAIQAHCRSVGALLCVDAYQTTGVYPYDVTEWDLDIVTGGSHKWLCGGPGCGWIYVKPSLLERFRPAVTGWMAHARPFAFEAAPIVLRAVDVPLRQRHADDSRLRRRAARARDRSRRSASRAFANTTCA